MRILLTNNLFYSFSSLTSVQRDQDIVTILLNVRIQIMYTVKIIESYVYSLI